MTTSRDDLKRRKNMLILELEMVRLNLKKKNIDRKVYDDDYATLGQEVLDLEKETEGSKRDSELEVVRDKMQEIQEKAHKDERRIDAGTFG